MLITIVSILIAVLLFLGLKTIWTAHATKSYSNIGHRTLSKLTKWQRRKFDAWKVTPLKQLLSVTAHLIYLDETVASKLGRNLQKAGVTATPREYTARKYIIVASGICLALFLFFLKFYLGIVIAALVTAFALMKQRDILSAKIRKKELTISQEMPRFARTISRSLQSDRDLFNVMSAYRKVAGPELGSELDILLAEMHSGNTQSALIHFENRLGTSEAFQLCSALRDMSLGVDQTATLNYIADDMAQHAKENIKKELSLRPGKMRRTYYPAIAVCIAIILYVLVVYVINNLNNLF
jgi:Flp pilus assembly protein TadB